MDPMVAYTEADFNAAQRRKTKAIVARSKNAISSMEQITELAMDLKARMDKTQVQDWVCLVNDVESEWMATVECVRKLQLMLDGCESVELAEGRLKDT